LLIPFLFSLSWNRNRSGGREQTHLPNWLPARRAAAGRHLR
jgi:hypothetical protein